MNPEVVLLILRVLLALVLYAFFGYALYLIWRSLPRMTSDEHMIPEMYLNAYQDERLISGHRLQRINLIGRAADNTIVLPDELASAHHARITFHGGQWVLEDLGSRNGTFVNEHPLESPLVVTLADRILIGASTLEMVDAAPLGETISTS